jgi:DNA-binding FadR family transcriptional regulator
MDDARDLQSPQARANWNDADRLFHRQLGVMTANPVLIAICDYIAELMDQPLWRRLRDESIAVHGRAQIHMAEHRMIYESVSSGDPEVAEFYATEHIRRVRRYMTLD